jgi:hypothetical protein
MNLIKHFFNKVIPLIKNLPGFDRLCYVVQYSLSSEETRATPLGFKFCGNRSMEQGTLIPDNAIKKAVLNNATSEDVDRQEYGCGCFWFSRKEDQVNGTEIT